MNFNLARPLPAYWHSLNCLVKNWKFYKERIKHVYEMVSNVLRWVTGNYWGFSLCFLFLLLLYFMSMSWLAKLDFYWLFYTLSLLKSWVCLCVFLGMCRVGRSWEYCFKTVVSMQQIGVNAEVGTKCGLLHSLF